MKKAIFSILFWVGAISITVLCGTLLIDSYISSFDKYSSNNLNQLPNHEVGLLLGTAKYTSLGYSNLFYAYRLEAAVELYSCGKIKKILVSGDNATRRYNEPQTMFNDLVEMGVEPKDIFLDFAGFRTFDSVIRAKKVFKQNKVLIISQQFHNERALFLARKNGIEAVAYNTRAVDFMFSPKTFIREKLARVKAILDIYILNTQPKFLGEEVIIS